MGTIAPVDNGAIRILMIDDHRIVLAALRKLIEMQPNMLVVGEANNRLDAVAMASREQPDIILLDLIMGTENGIEYISELLRVTKQSRIIILTSVQDTKVHQVAVQAGAMGVVLKEKTPEVLFKAIEKVNAGEVWLDRSMIANVVAEVSRQGREGNNNPEEARIKTLTKREGEIITLVAQGLKNKQIAKRLAISEITVRHHLTSVFSKLEVSDRFELIIYSYTYGLCEFQNVDIVQERAALRH